MRYVADVIPAKAKVLPEYFNETRQSLPVGNSRLGWINVTGAILFFIFALLKITHPVLFLFAGFLGIGLLPGVRPWLEKKLQFDYNRIVKLKLYGVLLIPFFLLAGHYSTQDQLLEKQHAFLKEQQERAAAIAQLKAQAHTDSVRAFIVQIEASRKKGRLSTADESAFFSQCDAMVWNSDDQQLVDEEKFVIRKEKTIQIVKSGKYDNAVALLDSLLAQHPDDAVLLYNRAYCYDKQGDIKQAVRELRLAMAAGSSEATALHEKVNPIVRHVVDYVTRCADGSTSFAKGRGACSHHGGVVNWNEPVYETSRKFE